MHLFGQTFSPLGGKCLVQETLIWSHTAYRRTYFIVFLYYNVIYTSCLPLFCSICETNETLCILIARVFEWPLADLYCNVHTGCFHSAELFKVLAVVFIECVGLNYNNTVASPAFTPALRSFFLFIRLLYYVLCFFNFLALEGNRSPLLWLSSALSGYMCIAPRALQSSLSFTLGFFFVYL